MNNTKCNNFNRYTGNLTNRKQTRDNVTLTESFTYDEILHSRLKTWQVAGLQQYQANYNNLGNITGKSDVVDLTFDGEFTYGLEGPHAVTGLVEPTQAYQAQATDQTIEYTPFNKTRRIDQTKEESVYTYSIDYGPDQTRKMSILFKNYVVDSYKHYVGDYEVEFDGEGNKRELHYISGGDGIFAIYVKEDETWKMYYVHKDHLGSPYCLTDKLGQIPVFNGKEQCFSFDPWGRRRNATDWSYNSVPTKDERLFDRGFTGHEHLDLFGLINMPACRSISGGRNGRTYDPWLGRMLQPDNYVQDGGYSQSYNRYSYCANNPLKYTDPSGEIWHLVVGAAIGGVSNWMMNGAKFSWKGLGHFGVGAAAGALGAGIGVAYTGGSFGAGFMGTASVTASSLGVAGGFTSGFGAGFSSGFISGAGNSLIAGNDLKKSIKTGLGVGLTLGAIGGGIGGVVGGFSAYSAGNHPFTGKPPHYETNLKDFSLVYQNDPMNCKNATLESIENMNGGTRTQGDFKRLGDAFLSKNPNAKLDEYFEYFGYNIENPAGKSHRFIGNLMKTGNPTVIDENIGGGHTLTITKIRQWTPRSNVKVWFGDPTRGIWKSNWNILGNPNFNKSAYLFWLK